MNNLYKKLDLQLDILLEQMHELNMARHIYYEIKSVVESNQQILTSNHFYSWMDHTYTTTMIMGIRRLVDHDSRSISFVTFLSDIRDNPHILSRSTYKGLYESMCSQLPESYRDEQFDELVGTGLDHVDPAIVEQELEKLRIITCKLKKYANKRVAHYDNNSPPLGPSYEEINEAFNILRELLLKYHHFFRAASFSLGPYIQYDWKQIFRVAWIPPLD
jgi:hypothetical protein